MESTQENTCLQHLIMALILTFPKKRQLILFIIYEMLVYKVHFDPWDGVYSEALAGRWNFFIFTFTLKFHFTAMASYC